MAWPQTRHALWCPWWRYPIEPCVCGFRAEIQVQPDREFWWWLGYTTQALKAIWWLLLALVLLDTTIILIGVHL